MLSHTTVLVSGLQSPLLTCSITRHGSSSVAKAHECEGTSCPILSGLGVSKSIYVPRACGRPIQMTYFAPFMKPLPTESF